MTLLELARLVQNVRSRQDAYNYEAMYLDTVPALAQLAELEKLEKQLDEAVAAVINQEDETHGRELGERGGS